MIVVDANVAVKWFVREPGWENAEQVAAYASLSAPAHLVVEVGRALLRNLRAGTIVPEAATAALRGLSAAVTLVPTEDLIEIAFEIALASSVTIVVAPSRGPPDELGGDRPRRLLSP
jgi:predicted nucleic acid-binding protein